MSRRLSRRTLLRGLGVSLALPLLDAMTPAFAAAPSKPACRMLVNYVPNGMVMPNWLPAATGADFALPPILQPDGGPFADRILLIEGLAQHNGWPNGDGTGDHARAASTYLTGVHVRKTGGSDIAAGISMDQIAAQQIGSRTRIPSLELTCEDGRMVGVCDTGYSCVYSNNISWRSATTPSSPEVDPRAVFETLFGSEDPDPSVRAVTRRRDSSILDWVLGETHTLETQLGPGDRSKLDEYLTSVREIELRIQSAETSGPEPVRAPMSKPSAIPAQLAGHLRLMYDLLRIAFQTDSTRIATLMVGRDSGSLRSYDEIGVPEPHHPITHHQGRADLIEKVALINRHHMQLFSEFVESLAHTPDGDGSLLDHTMILYGAGLADGNSHQHDLLPTMLVGGGFRMGRVIQTTPQTPLTNLYISMLGRMGVEVEKLGDSSGRLPELVDLT